MCVGGHAPGCGRLWVAGVYAWRIKAGVFNGEGVLSRVFTADARCSEHTHVCHYAKFKTKLKLNNFWPSYSDLAY